MKIAISFTVANNVKVIPGKKRTWAAYYTSPQSFIFIFSNSLG